MENVYGVALTPCELLLLIGRCGVTVLEAGVDSVRADVWRCGRVAVERKPGVGPGFRGGGYRLFRGLSLAVGLHFWC